MGPIDVAVIVAGATDPASLRDLPAGAVVIAADSGVDAALAAGLVPALVVGDLDSATPASVERAVAAGSVVDRHPPDKDATDLELALDHAVAAGAAHVVVVADLDGRADHALANVLLLASARYAAIARVEARVAGATVRVVRAGRPALLAAEAGDLVSLLPVGGPARGVRTVGLRFPLVGETLEPGTSRGVSNEALDGPVSVEVGAGTLLAILPGRAGAAPATPDPSSRSPVPSPSPAPSPLLPATPPTSGAIPEVP